VGDLPSQRNTRKEAKCFTDIKEKYLWGNVRPRKKGEGDINSDISSPTLADSQRENEKK